MAVTQRLAGEHLGYKKYTDSRFVCELPLLIMKLSFNVILETYKALEGKGEQGVRFQLYVSNLIPQRSNCPRVSANFYQLYRSQRTNTKVVPRPPG